MSTELSIIIPCYNEAANLDALISKLKSLSHPHFAPEIILVDNGSKDQTPQILKSRETELSAFSIKTIRVEINQGYGYGILCGLNAAKGKVLAWTHADLQTNPADVLRAHQYYLLEKNENCIVKGRRVNRPFIADTLSRGMQWVASLALGVKLNEINAQPKLFSKAFYEKHIENEAPWDFSLDLFLLLKAARYGQIKEIEVRFDNRVAGEAKGGGGSLKNRWKLIKRTWAYIFELRNKERNLASLKSK